MLGKSVFPAPLVVGTVKRTVLDTELPASPAKGMVSQVLMKGKQEEMVLQGG